MRRGIMKVAIEDVHPNPSQPRKAFDDDALDDLAQSIRQQGLMQPILVRRMDEGYEIVAGERRWRASQRAGLKTIEVIVRDLSEPEAFSWALIENIQREDLNPIESAMAFRHVIDEHGFTQEQLAERIGKDRSTISNSLRLLRLPNEVRRQVVSGALSMGHARALLSLESDDQMVKAAREILKKGLSVRQVEKMVRALRARTKLEKSGKDPDSAEVDRYAGIPGGAPAVRRETEKLVRKLSTRVRIAVQGRKGKIEIDFASPEELDRLLALIKGR